MIRHQVSLAGHARRVVEVEVAFDVPPGTRAQDVAFPVWTPGSYLVREHARHVNDLAAFAGRNRLAVEKTAKNVYRIATRGARRITLRYEVYAHELTVRTSHVDPSHAFLNPVNFLPILPGREGERQRLAIVQVPRGWDVACALPEQAPHVFVARDYDELADSPLECGPHALPARRTTFRARGVPHEVVHWGASPLDLKAFAKDCARIVEAQAALFGGLPYNRYVFIVHASDSGRGGLEHRSSTALLYPRGSLAHKDGYTDLLSLVSHELFHAWNVKRIRPAAFTPYDFGRENHTRLLWAFEGLTSYYEDVFLRRAGLLSPEALLDGFAERLTQLARGSGRQRHTVEEASWDAWIRYYRQDENSEESSVSYYLKGSLVGLLLDLELRRASEGEKSLDDVMRLIWSRYGRTGTGVPEDGIEAACAEVGGRRVRALFDVAVRGTGELPLGDALAAHGIRLERRAPTGPDDRGGRAGGGKSLPSASGLVLKADGDRVRVAVVRRGSPAEAAGLCPGDELVALDGLRAEGAAVLSRLHGARAGSVHKLTIFRRDELREVSIKTRAAASDVVSLEVDADAPAAARALRVKWLGTPA